MEVRVLSSAPVARKRATPPARAAFSFPLLLLLGGTALAADFARGLRAYQSGDYATALSEWTPLAEQGVVEAQYDVGLIHYLGKGVAQDRALAHRWFLRAAEAGYARAQYRVAEMCEAGDGVRQDLVQARVWFTLAEKQRYEDARRRRKSVSRRMSPEQIALADMQVRHRRAGDAQSTSSSPPSR